MDMRAIITLHNGKYANVPADLMEIDDDRLWVYNGRNLVGYFDMKTVENAYISMSNNGERQ